MTPPHNDSGFEIDEQLAELLDQARALLGRDASDEEIIAMALDELGDDRLAAEYDDVVAAELRQQANREGVVPIGLARVERRRRLRRR